MSARLTPAQRDALVLLSAPGAEAHIDERSLRWRVLVDGEQIGAIYSETLKHLRDAGLIEWRQVGDGENRFRQRITPAGAEMARRFEAARLLQEARP